MPTSPAAAERPRDPKQSNETLAPVRWGVLGASNFALKVSLPGMKRGPLTQLAALASRDIGKARAAARSLGIPKAYGSYEELLADPDIEAIYNPLPNHLHVPWSRARSRPASTCCARSRSRSAPREAARAASRRATTGKLDRRGVHGPQPPAVAAAREWVRSGRIGELVSVQAAFSYFNRDAANIRNRKDIGGGALLRHRLLRVNTSRFLFGREPRAGGGADRRDPDFGTDRLTSGAARLRRRRT